jgi:hypothetical protein
MTIYQPYASLISIGVKKFETRSWATKYRGKIAIHAAKKPYSHYDYSCTFYNAVNRAGIAEMPYGAVIATAELVDCWRIMDCHNGTALLYKPTPPGEKFDEQHRPLIDGNEYLFGNYRDGYYAWQLENVKILEKPIPARGQQGLWNWNACDYCKNLDGLLCARASRKCEFEVDYDKATT